MEGCTEKYVLLKERQDLSGPRNIGIKSVREDRQHLQSDQGPGRPDSGGNA